MATDQHKYKLLRGLGVPHGYAVALAGGEPYADDVAAALKAIGDQITDLSDEIASLTSTVSALADTVAALDTRVEALENP